MAKTMAPHPVGLSEDPNISRIDCISFAAQFCSPFILPTRTIDRGRGEEEEEEEEEDVSDRQRKMETLLAFAETPGG